MSEKNHGRRYSFSKKKEILKYLENHTYKETCKKYGISEPTLSRWRKMIKSESKKNRLKLIISLPKFWLEYLNEQIEADVWEDYSDAILNLIRYYFRSQTSIQNVDSTYIENIEKVISTFIKLTPDIDSIVVSNSTKVLHKTERWESTEGINNLIEDWKKLSSEWKKASSGKIKGRPAKITEFEFQNNRYNIRDLSVKHLIGAPINLSYGFLLGMKRKLGHDNIYIIAKTKRFPLDLNILTLMDALKKITMGTIPTIKEENKIIDSINQGYQRLNEEIAAKKYARQRPNEEMAAEWRQNHPELMKQQKKNLIDIAKQVNHPLNQNEKDVIDALEKQIGKKIERITSSFEEVKEPEKMFGLGREFPVHVNIIMPPIDEDFPAHIFPCHYLALNGKVILLSLFNLGLSEFPSEILNLKNLTYLCLNSSSISEFPKQFSNLKSLETLYLDKNQFTLVPESIIELPKLHFLSMQNNKISQIPVGLTQRYMRYVPKFPKYVGGFTYLNFMGNKIKNDSLSKEQQTLVLNMILLV
jgi:hypothetical protein